MQTSSPILEKPTYEGENRPTLNVVIVYEDFAAGKHAQETYDFLVNQLGQDFDFNNQMWKFDVLENAKMRELAVRDTAASDLVLVSTHGSGELPDGTKCWLNQWAESKGSAKALVALVDRPVNLFGETSAIRSFLQVVARRAGVDFFGQPDDLPEREDDFSTEQIHDRAERTSLILTDFIHQTATADDTHWGINE